MPTWLLIIVIIVALLGVLGAVERITVFEFERAVRYHRGRFAAVLGPGQYLLFRWTTSATKLDMRPRFVSVAGQEVLSADGITLKVSLAAEYRVVDPAAAVNDVEDHAVALYLTLQVALRELIGDVPIDDVLAQRGELAARILERCGPRAPDFGLELARVDVKDIMFPGDLKRTFAQVADARQQGLAALERARSETAALRSLANAARTIENSPGLFQLRILQEIGQSGGNTIVFGVPSSAVPLTNASDVTAAPSGAHGEAAGPAPDG